MIPRRSIMALCFLTALTAVIAQEDPTITSTSASSSTTTTAASTVPSMATATPEPTSESSQYYPSAPGQSYDTGNPNGIIDETNQQQTNDGASGKSDNFMMIPLGAQIGIISAIVVVGVGALVASVMWYMRRRRQWELNGRRSTVPRIAVNSRGEFSVGDVPGGASGLRTSSVNSFDNTALEKGNVKSEFEGENTAAPKGWKRFISGR